MSLNCVLCKFKIDEHPLGWMDVSGWSSIPARGSQDRPYVHHALSLMSQLFIFASVLGSQTKHTLGNLTVLFL
jgi:hypothetical protein